MTDDETALDIRQLSKFYGPARALSDVTLSIERGRVSALVGHNGAGKSTLLRSLSGAERPDGGEIRIAGNIVNFTSPSDATAAGIACVYQELSLVDQLSVAQNLFLGRELVRGGRLNQREMNAQSERLCAEFHIPASPTDLVGTLPVAQKQMIEVARAVNRGSRFLLLDEPTTALEQSQVQELFTTIRALAAQGLGVLFVDHKLDEVFAIADHVIGLANGRVVLDGPVSTVDRGAVIRAVVGHKAAVGLGAAEPAPNQPQDATTPSTRPLSEAPPVLDVRHVAGARLGDISLHVRAGEVLGIYGLVGAGRSRFLRTVYGDEPLIGGTMTLDEEPYAPANPRDAVRRGIAFVSEERKLDGIFPQLSGSDNVVLPVLRRFARWGVLQWSSLRLSADEVLARVELRGDARASVSSLSGGNQQKVLFARAALQAPRVLLLDEPTKGVDIGAKSEIYSIIQTLAREKGVAVIVVSTEEEELITISDQITIFRGGVCSGELHPASQVTPAMLRELAWSATS